MKTKTVKRLAILLVAAGLTGGGAYVLWGYQVDRMAGKVVKQAAAAEAKKDYAEAAKLYAQHMRVVPEDVEVQIKYADDLLRLGALRKNQEDAMAIYDDVLKRTPGRDEVRRKVADLAFAMGHYARAREHLSNLLKHTPEDGHLEFLMGQCQDNDRDFQEAAKSYRAAIKHGAADRVGASSRLAVLLRGPLGQAAEADRVVEEMVRAAPEDHRAYLERGRYRRRFEIDGAAADFQKALELAPDQAETYLEVARQAEQAEGAAAARAVLEKGLAAAPKTIALYMAMADLERRGGRLDRAIETMENGLKTMPENLELRFQIALWLAATGDSKKLRLQIEELKGLGANHVLTDYLNACYLVNIKEFNKARRALTALQPLVARDPAWKSRVNVLLARCYGQLGEPELQKDASERAVAANPDDLTAVLELIAGMERRGDIDGAIKEQRRLLERAPRMRLPLVRLLMLRNERLPDDRRDWGEAERLLDAAEKDDPASVEPLVLRAFLDADRGQPARARAALAAARSRFPKETAPRVAEAELSGREKKYDEALARLDEARKDLGDRIEFRRARAALWTAKGGPAAVAALNGLGEKTEAFPAAGRRELLALLGRELGRLQDLRGAARMWSRVAELDPQDLDARLQLFNLAVESADTSEIERQIEEVGKIDEARGRVCRLNYWIWRAGRADAPAERARLRADARALLSELKTRRPDWSLLALATARLEEQELAQDPLDEARKRAKQDALVVAYRQAIEQGAGDAAVVRRVVQLLFATGRGAEAVQLLNQIAGTAQLPTDLGKMASQYALANRDFLQAEDLARKAVEAHPGDFAERIWLAQVLWRGGRNDAAEAVLRAGVDAAKEDGDRWASLVDFLTLTRQFEKAEAAVKAAEPNLARAPLALAQCCELLGRAYQGQAGAEARAKAWYGKARDWLAKAEAARKDHDNLTIERRIAEFLSRTGQTAEAREQLRAILGRQASGPGGDANAETIAWARRALALTYISGASPRPREALDVLEKGGVASSDDVLDQRALARVYYAQPDPEHRDRAIAVLRDLSSQNRAGLEDRLMLAEIEDQAGRWPEAREQFRELVLRAGAARDLASLKRRPHYLSRFARALLRRHKPGDDQDLDEARRLIDALEQLGPDLLETLALEVELDQARGRREEAAARIRSRVERPDLNADARAGLAALAEHAGQFDLAEQIHRKIAAQPGLANQLGLLQFLVRRDRVDEALDICEPLWKAGDHRETVARLAVGMLLGPKSSPDAEQVRRIAGWLEQGSREAPRAEIYRLGLGNLYERLGEIDKAEEQYQAIVREGDRTGVASNNLAWLMALHGGDGKAALELANHAVRLQNTNPDFLDTRGAVYLRGGDGTRALADFEASIVGAPSPAKYFHRAQAYLLLKDRDKARDSFQTARARGLPEGLHPLEMPVYQKILAELGG